MCLNFKHLSGNVFEYDLRCYRLPSFFMVSCYCEDRAKASRRKLCR